MRRPRMFYGWWIVAAGGVIALLQGGLYVYGFGVFYLPLLAALGSSRAALGGVLGLSQLQGGLIAPLAGWFIDRYGPRLSLFIGLTVMGMGFIALSRITALWMLYALFILMSTASSLGGGRPVLVAVTNWFVRKRGRAMGILQVGFGLGGSLSFALAWLINTFGWRTAAVVAGPVVVVMAVVAVVAKADFSVTGCSRHWGDRLRGKSPHESTRTRDSRSDHHRVATTRTKRTSI